MSRQINSCELIHPSPTRIESSILCKTQFEWFTKRNKKICTTDNLPWATYRFENSCEPVDRMKQNKFERLPYFFYKNVWNHEEHRLRSLQLKWYVSFQNALNEIRSNLAICHLFPMHEIGRIHKSDVKRSSLNLVTSISRDSLLRDVRHFWCNILPWRTEGLLDSSISAMFPQRSRNWRKNWIKLWILWPISEVFFLARPFPVVIRDLGSWTKVKFWLVKKTIDIHSSEHCVKTAEMHA